MLKVDERNFKKEVLDPRGPILVDFNATWCAPCRMMGPVLEDFEKENDIKVVSIDVDDNNSLARKYGVMSIPCIVLFKNGEEKNRNVGLMSNADLKEFIKE